MRCNLRFASERIGAAWVAPATMLVGGAFMKFNKLILNYVPNCQTGRAWAGNTKDATGILCKQREKERRFVVPPLVINVSAMDCQTTRQTATAWAICLATEVENKTVNLLRLRPNWPIGAA